MDQKEFMRQMGELVDYGRTKENVLTKAEIQDYCEDLLLTQEQLELVYAYLAEHRIQVPGYAGGGIPAGKDPVAEGADAADGNGRQGQADSKYLAVYRRELRALPVYASGEMAEMYEQLRDGDESVIPRIVEASLSRVAAIAGKYKGRGVLLEDLIQEGNLELMTCVSALCGSRETADVKKAIDHAVKSRLTQLVDEAIAGNDSESMILARVNLLLEATRVLAEEYGRIATLEELSEFAHMDRTEIEMYVELSRGKIELGGRR